MPTLEELFKSKQLTSQGGKTAEEAYAVQNSKKIRISSSNPLVSTVGMLPAKGARALLGIKGSESLLEEELVGLRIIRTGSIPFIYGSDVGRLTLKSTDSLQMMKDNVGNVTELDANGNPIPTGATGAFAKIGNVVGDIKSALGLPTKIIPSFVFAGFTKEDKENPNKRYKQLERIKASAAGTPANGLLGFIGKNAGGGTPDAMGRNLVGGAIKEGKQALAQKIFGSRAGGQLNTNTGQSGGFVLNDDYELSRSKLTTIFTQESLDFWGRWGFNYGMLEPSTPPEGDDKEGSKYSKTIDTRPDSRQDLSTKQIIDNIPTLKFSEEPQRVSKFGVGKTNYNAQKGTTEIDKATLFNNEKRNLRTYEDGVNKLGVYSGEGTDDNDKLDFVPLKFTSIHRNKTAQFRATITGLTETLSPSWDSGKFIGSPFSYYTYSGIERSVSFNFKVYSLNAEEHKIAWDKINFLNSLVYPQGYYTSSAVVPPFIKFTLGDMYSKKFAFIESLSHTFDDNTTWNITDSEIKLGRDTVGNPNGTDGTTIDMKGYRLPTIADVSVTIKFLESKSNTEARKFYSFDPQTN